MTEQWMQESLHVPPTMLAEFAASDADAWVDEAISTHLATCRYCVAIYAEFCRAHVGHALGTEMHAPVAELRTAAWRIPSRASGHTARARRRRTPCPFRGVAASAALVAILGAVVLQFLASGHDRYPDVLSGELRNRISQQLREDSYAGLLYGADLAPRARGTRGPVFGFGALDLRPVALEWREGEASAELGYWLVAGLLASGRQREADTYLRAAIERFPTDPRLHNLAAILAYKGSRLGAAEESLRQALVLGGDTSHELNLVRVLAEQGRTQEARELRHRIRERVPSEWMAKLLSEATVGSQVEWEHAGARTQALRDTVVDATPPGR